MSIEAINAYRQVYGFIPLAVCSRVADYAMLTTKLRLLGAVLVQPLVLEQIDTYLQCAGDRLAALRGVMAENAVMQELAETPLMLSVMTLIYQGTISEPLPVQGTIVEHWNQLFDTYVKHMFARRGVIVRYAQKQTIQSLTWLAQGMMRQSETVFYIEGLNVDWLAASKQQTIVRLGTAFITGLSLGVGFGLIIGLSCGLILGVGFGLIIGLSCGLIIGFVSGRRAYTTRFSPVRPAGRSLSPINGELPISSVEELVTTMRENAPEIGPANYRDWLLALMIPVHRPKIVHVNQVDWLVLTPSSRSFNSLGEGEILGLIMGLIGGLLGGLYFGLIVGLSFFVIGKLVDGLFLSFRLIEKLVDEFQYYSHAGIHRLIILLILWRSGAMPWNIPRFLDYCADRIFLRKVGGGYIFVHRLLMEHFASLHDAPSAEKPEQRDDHPRRQQGWP
jgi:hypothetical protein